MSMSWLEGMHRQMDGPGVDIQTHDAAMQRVVQRGAIPVTWLDVLFEFQRDWMRQDAYDAVIQIMLQHAAGLGEGISFLFGMTSSAVTASADRRERHKP